MSMCGIQVSAILVPFYLLFKKDTVDSWDIPNTL